jgi:hypothetical protein
MRRRRRLASQPIHSPEMWRDVVIHTRAQRAMPARAAKGAVPSANSIFVFERGYSRLTDIASGRK